MPGFRFGGMIPTSLARDQLQISRALDHEIHTSFTQNYGVQQGEAIPFSVGIRLEPTGVIDVMHCNVTRGVGASAPRERIVRAASSRRAKPVVLDRNTGEHEREELPGEPTRASTCRMVRRFRTC